MREAPRRGLIVEDDALIAILIEDILIELGCEVAAIATTVEGALQAAAENAPDFVLLDVNLGPDQDSFPVADHLTRSGVPFAFLTGYGAGAMPPAYRDTPVLEKPIDPEALREVIQGLV